MKHVISILPMLVAAVVLSSCKGQSEHQNETLLVSTERVQTTQHLGQRPYVGTVEALESTIASFTGTGTLTSVPVEEGQTVQRGQVIAVLDKVQCENTVKATKAMLDQALDAQKRMKQLYDSNSIPEIKWIEVESQVQQAQSSYDMAVKALSDCTLRAPASGVIGTKFLKAGEVALPSQPVVDILNINKVKVRASVPESEISHIESATNTTIHVDALNLDFQGGRIEKGVTADALTHSYDIRVLVDNPQHNLLPGMVAQVTLDASAVQNQSAITVPVRSVQQDSRGQQFVWVAREGKAHRLPVSVGEVYGNRIVITCGLNEGEQLITAGYQKVSEGSAVKY